jgi:hypothetical protein
LYLIREIHVMFIFCSILMLRYKFTFWLVFLHYSDLVKTTWTSDYVLFEDYFCYMRRSFLQNACSIFEDYFCDMEEQHSR